MNLIDIGMDIVEISEFQEKIHKTPGILEKFLTNEELHEATSIQSQAAVFAAKEAVMKTGYVKPGEWLKVQVHHTSSGKPFFVDTFGQRLPQILLTITHTKTYTAAVVVLLETS